jgi:hypothetical protein
LKLLGSIAAVELLSPLDREAMFVLMDRIYANMRRDSFEADLDRKQWVIRLEDPATNRLVGFSTQALLEVSVAGKPIKALFSGDTVVEREHWGDTALASCWGKFAIQLIDQHQTSPLYWFLISKGFRTYRYLPLFFREYFPNYQSATPEDTLQILSALGSHIAPDHYASQSQIILARPQKEYVRPEFNDAATRALPDCHVRYFLKRNPHHDRGDELCCLAPLTRENFTSLAWRMIRSLPRVQALSAGCEVD